MAMFAGFTPAVQKGPKWVNPKNGKVWRVKASNMSPNPNDKFVVDGRNVVAGMNGSGYTTIGTGAVRWFDPSVKTGKMLTENFKIYKFFGEYTQAQNQVPWMIQQCARVNTPVWSFINFGETHDPYRFNGSGYNGVAAYKRMGDKKKARNIVFDQQKTCVEYIDRQLKPLLDQFKRANGTVMITADHGELFGEDGLWQHQDHHEMTTTVPLILNVQGTKI
jgi:hypothetical protein